MAAIEFAIVAPVMVFIMFGIIAYGVFFGAANTVQQLAANSARAAMGGLDQDERQALVDDYIAHFLAKDALLLDEHLSVSLVADDEESDFLFVTVSYDASYLPVWSLYQGLPLPEKTITRQSVIRTGGY